MATVYHDHDHERLSGLTLAVIGFGSQGHAYALNLRDSGQQVVVGLAQGSRSRAHAEAEGLDVRDVGEAVPAADVVMLLTPDTVQPALFRDVIAPALRTGATLMFAHGFNIRYAQIEVDPSIDVSMVAPKAPGHRLRELYRNGAGTPALVAVAQDPSGEALPIALAYAKAIGCTRAGVLETTFAEETETDLFGEQAVLCGGTSALVRAGFETLVEAGYQPEIAYFECLHELKLIVDLMYRGGLSAMWHSVSDTAEHGGYEGGARIVGPEVRQAMRAILDDVRDGSYARRLIDESAHGGDTFVRAREAERGHPIEQIGADLRARMPFLKTQTAPSPVDQRGHDDVPWHESFTIGIP